MSRYLEKPIIFIGFPRSGTTIISEILLQHHSLAWISNYQHKVPGCAGINLVRNIFHNRFWNLSGQKKQLNRVPLLNKYIFKPVESYRFWKHLTRSDFAKSFLFKEVEKPDKVHEIRLFLERLVKYQSRERLAFKTTGPSRLRYLHSIFPDACFIRVRRNPLPTIRSLLKVGFWNKGEGRSKLWWKDDVYSDFEKSYLKNLEQKHKAPLMAALQYYKINQVHSIEQKLCDANVYELMYEDFIDNPTKAINEMLVFCSLQMDQGITSYLNKNKIYNRNIKQKFYISPELDSEVLRIATGGVHQYS